MEEHFNENYMESEKSQKYFQRKNQWTQKIDLLSKEQISITSPEILNNSWSSRERTFDVVIRIHDGKMKANKIQYSISRS